MAFQPCQIIDQTISKSNSWLTSLLVLPNISGNAWKPSSEVLLKILPLFSRAPLGVHTLVYEHYFTCSWLPKYRIWILRLVCVQYEIILYYSRAHKLPTAFSSGCAHQTAKFLTVHAWAGQLCTSASIQVCSPQCQACLSVVCVQT